MKSETGSLAVEAALVIPIILVVLLAVAELFMIAVYPSRDGGRRPGRCPGWRPPIPTPLGRRRP